MGGGEVKTSVIVALAFAVSMAAPIAAAAQTAEPAAPNHHYKIHRHRGPLHTIHRHSVAHNPAPPAAPVVVGPARASQAQPFGLAFPHIAPYPNNKGDEDGLSEDVNDCNKGCIDGNAPN
jgi:hypothetical protein